MKIELISVGSVLATIWLLAWLGLRGSNFLQDPKGEPRAFEPHITRYQDFAKLLLVMATASLAFLINFLINLPNLGSARNAYSLALETYCGVAITLLCVSAFFTLVFMLVQTYSYEAYCHGGSYPAWLYSLHLAIGYSAVIWFAFAYSYLAYHLIPLTRVRSGAQILTSVVLQPAANGIGVLPLNVASPQTVPMLASPNAGLYALLGWFGGSATTVAGSWIASKIRVYHDNRKTHRDELKENVLIPLRSCLEERFAPLVSMRNPAVTSAWTQISFAPGAPAAETQTKFDMVLEAEKPWRQFKALVDPALYQDAKTKHVHELLGSAEAFASAWDSYSEQVRAWIQEMAHQVATATDIPQMKGGTATGPFVDSGFLATFVYKRLCGIPIASLNRGSTGGDLWDLKCSNTNVAAAASDKLTLLMSCVDALIISQQQKGELFTSRAKDLAKKLDSLEGEVRLALASARLRGRCDLVPFF